MKKIAAFLLAALLALTLAGCGQPDQPEKPSGGEDNPSAPEQPGGNETDENEYRVQLVSGGAAYLPENMEALWTDADGRIYRSAFGKDGIARQSGLDGDYQVTLSSLPEGYSYNPNIYTATNFKRDVTIELYTINTVLGKGTEANPYGLGPFGVYRATLENPDDTVWFEYFPSTSGTYVAESWLDVTANVINPIMDVYNSNAGGFNQFNRTQDGGGSSASFTKNFRLEMSVAKDEIGNVFRFVVRTQALNENAFPVDIDFSLGLIGDYEREEIEYTPISPTEQFPAGRITIPSGKFTEIGMSSPNGVLDGSKFALNPADGYYYEWDAEANGGAGAFGKPLYVKISKDGVILDTDSHSQFLDALVSLRLYCGKGAAYDYTSFIAQYAAHVHSSTGVYPVTEELKLFLQRYSVSQRLFFDGNGLAEIYGYYAAEDDQWLWACGIFV